MYEVIVSEKPKAMEGKIVQYRRKDGFTVFLNGDKILDEIRLKMPKEIVIVAVAIRRAQQIARNYARKYAPELLERFEIDDRQLEKILRLRVENKKGEV